MTHGNYLSRTIITALAAVLLSTAAIADTETTVTVAKEISALRATEELSVERAENATKVATENAIAAVLEDTKLDLDIRLIGPTSTTIASDR